MELMNSQSEGASLVGTVVDLKDHDNQWRLWPTPATSQPFAASIDDLGFERWNRVNYDMDEEDIVFCRRMRISPDHFEWIIDRLEKVPKKTSGRP